MRSLLRLDRHARLRFAPLQGPAAQSYLRSRGLPTADFDTLVFVPDWSRPGLAEPLFRSTGALAALRSTGAVGRVLAAVFGLIPTPFRDTIYRAVGHWRYRIFGPWRPQPLPRSEWRQQFLERVE